MHFFKKREGPQQVFLSLIIIAVDQVIRELLISRIELLVGRLQFSQIVKLVGIEYEHSFSFSELKKCDAAVKRSVQLNDLLVIAGGFQPANRFSLQDFTIMVHE